MALCFSSFAAEEGEDSSTGLPEKYAKDYLIASGTLSPDKKFAVMYPAEDPEEVPGHGDYLVSLKPFAILAKLETKRPKFTSQKVTREFAGVHKHEE